MSKPVQRHYGQLVDAFSVSHLQRFRQPYLLNPNHATVSHDSPLAEQKMMKNRKFEIQPAELKGEMAKYLEELGYGA